MRLEISHDLIQKLSSKHSQKFDTNTNGLSRMPPSEIFSGDQAIQRIRMEVTQEEWYGNLVNPDLKPRFARTPVRKSIVIPPNSSYPHLTLDINHHEYFPRKGIVVLHIDSMHYSTSKTGKRVFFKEGTQKGVFIPVEIDAEMIPQISLMNKWLHKSKLPISIEQPSQDISAEVEGLSLEPEASVASIEIDEKTAIAVGGAGKKPKKKKKKSKPVETVDVAHFLDEEVLEENVKFSDLPSMFGVKIIEDLPPDLLVKFYEYEVSMIQFVTGDKLKMLMKRSSDVTASHETALQHHFLLTRKRGRKVNDLTFVEMMFEKLRSFSIPKVTDYQLRDLLPPTLQALPDVPKKMKPVFSSALKFATMIYGVLLQDIRVNELHQNVWHFMDFCQKIYGEDNAYFFQLLAVNQLGKLSLIRSSKDKMETASLFMSQLDRPQLLDRYVSIKEFELDRSFAELTNLLEETMQTFRHFKSLPEDAIARLTVKSLEGKSAKKKAEVAQIVGAESEADLAKNEFYYKAIGVYETDIQELMKMMQEEFSKLVAGGASGRRKR
ncbi:hypothetical protein [Aureibacter tunicatorum]|uniref:Uncharacterized protein n=1 Tax=Aureibacter tunicatorum TaxID=866807 RepID=A0AAE3XJ26_9BACT|nr:hypothetical protein [Aureibacter tunicatorum]MDR6237307.1 hypothetical protein [Aureibacter tunicatorum]BDD06298.1 hypothetical protein AUTU_37810 [Aureibacter tunicatorum]